MDIVAGTLLLIGTLFTLIGSIGLVRLPDFYTRMHAPTKATTLGVSSVLVAAALTVPGGVAAVGLKLLLVIIFLFLTTPIGAHMMGRAARHAGIGYCAQTQVDELPAAVPDPVGVEIPAHSTIDDQA